MSDIIEVKEDGSVIIEEEKSNETKHDDHPDVYNWMMEAFKDQMMRVLDAYEKGKEE